MSGLLSVVSEGDAVQLEALLEHQAHLVNAIEASAPKPGLLLCTLSAYVCTQHLRLQVRHSLLDLSAPADRCIFWQFLTSLYVLCAVISPMYMHVL